MKQKGIPFWKKSLSIMIILLTLLLSGFTFWAMVPQQPTDEVDSLILSDERVQVVNTSYLAFLPVNELHNNQDRSAGLIIYPGARVSASSYAFIGRELALQGISVFILKPPLRLAILQANGAQEVIDDYPMIKKWYLGGHSLGGATASIFAYDHLESIEGIIYLAAYPVESKDFSETTLRALTIYGSEDGFATVDDILKYDYLQPNDYTKALIDGGNHEQFGYYGRQKGDNPAFISREEQQRIIVDTLIQFIQPSQ